MTTLRLALAGALAACGLVLVTPVVSHACDCASAPVPERLGRADVVFVGALMESTPGQRRSSLDPTSYSFSVGRVIQGRASSFEVVESAWSGASCGLENMEVGREYVVFATRDQDDQDVLVSGLCSGTQQADPAYVAEVAAAAGPPRPEIPYVADALVTFLGFFA
ncbi:hypothetical protein [Nocardioides sp. SR21]|uniref:hypothetical protein n=1 Tax=Nocardioides sp. SR21 TaxID=2919501 RepID=UPI001FAA64EC|nr:hypothetical protein [Nocardioides sp. SR21]